MALIIKESERGLTVAEIVQKARSGATLDESELTVLLSLEQESDREFLFAAAREVRTEVFGAGIILYGFVYLSTYCRNDCYFCNFRISQEKERYRKNTEEILEAARSLAQSGVHLIDLTLGEDPYFLSEKGFSELCQVIREIRRETALPVMLSPGLLTRTQLRQAREAGAQWYACYQETHNRDLFSGWRRGQDFDERLECKRLAIEEGFLVEEGVLVGAGAGPSDLATSILAMKSLGARQVRAMGYVPVPGGLPAGAGLEASIQELLMIACLRLSIPSANIPASLDVEGLAGLGPRLMAGANVVTSMVPSGRGLAGVAQVEFDIENEKRSPEAVAQMLGSFGLRVAERPEA